MSPASPWNAQLDAFGGNDDPDSDRADLEAWRMQAAKNFTVRQFSGGHFSTCRPARSFSAPWPNPLPPPVEMGIAA